MAPSSQQWKQENIPLFVIGADVLSYKSVRKLTKRLGTDRWQS